MKSTEEEPASEEKERKIGCICNTCGFYRDDCQCDEYSSTEGRMYNE